MIPSNALEEKIAILAKTPDDQLQLFSPLEQAIILALKRYIQEKTDLSRSMGK